MSQYLPYGKKIVPTQAQMEQQTLKFQQYEYYGIPYDYFDGAEGEGYKSQKDVDREKARLLILSGKEIPEDLATRLLQYKQNENVKKQ